MRKTNKRIIIRIKITDRIIFTNMSNISIQGQLKSKKTLYRALVGRHCRFLEINLEPEDWEVVTMAFFQNNFGIRIVSIIRGRCRTLLVFVLITYHCLIILLMYVYR